MDSIDTATLIQKPYLAGASGWRESGYFWIKTMKLKTRPR